jgi:hypothetical protein
LLSIASCSAVLLFLTRVRLIDFTASRLQTPDGDVVFCDLELEDGLFDGPKGKPQFETYRWGALRLMHLHGADSCSRV